MISKNLIYKIFDRNIPVRNKSLELYFKGYCAKNINQYDYY